MTSRRRGKITDILVPPLVHRYPSTKSHRDEGSPLVTPFTIFFAASATTLLTAGWHQSPGESTICRDDHAAESKDNREHGRVLGDWEP